MAYGQDFKKSARRHLESATVLFETATPALQKGCNAVSGYLFGLSGELAIKAIMRENGLRPLPNEERRDDPFYAHFPELKTLIRDSAGGRRLGRVFQLVSSGPLFENWDTQMRYAPTSDIQQTWVTKWKSEAETLIEEMSLV